MSWRQPPICRPFCRAPVSAARSEPSVLVVPSVLSAARNRIHRRVSAAATHATRHARLRVLGARGHVGRRDCAAAGVCDERASCACLPVASVCTLGQRCVHMTRAAVLQTECVCTTRARLAAAVEIVVVCCARRVRVERPGWLRLQMCGALVQHGGAGLAVCRRQRCGVCVVGLPRHVGACRAACNRSAACMQRVRATRRRQARCMRVRA